MSKLDEIMVKGDPELLGDHLGVFTARSTERKVTKVTQDGGIASAVMIYGLEEGLFDGVIAAVADPDDPEEPWKPRPVVITDPDEVLEAAGTKYTYCPNVSVLKEAVRSYGCEKVAMVGTPCQIRAVRKAQLCPIGMRHVPDKIELLIGIICMENFPYEGMKTIIEQLCGVWIREVTKMDIGNGKFWVYTKDGEVKSIPIDETHPFEGEPCHVCTDYCAELSDLTAGSVGSPDGWSTVIVRTEKAKEILDDMVEQGLLEVKSIEEVKPGLGLIQKLAQVKKNKNQKEIEERKELGLPEPGKVHESL
ncbi:coenzyme F420 hydrogenase subunit beta [Methanopyrus kandleri]|uniref:Coenzyme F420 hydrogenase subunit beta n=2 Tax=Methanopyrus kandleri TaxID=2320 RepID=Q8TWV2_METKA|nr:coenzyme F420 hydrogenase subunit beta [Methanopyrus kandleri]AAM02142.1 Coenzyme F420-reducing hydrogenase, beta subunit [Methanopyrus kandleri AV19]